MSKNGCFICINTILMITTRILNGKGPLLLANAFLPVSKVAKGVYEVMKPDSYLSPNIEIPWEKYATPQGYGVYLRGTFIFRRVDKIWITISDPELAHILHYAIQKFQKGTPITFEDLALECNKESILKSAVVLGLLGDSIRPQREEENRKYFISKNWIEKTRSMNAYLFGLSLMEHYRQKTLLPIATYWWRYRTCLSKNTRFVDDTMLFHGRVVEDPIVVHYAKCFSDALVGNLIERCGPEELKILSVLAGAGILDLKNETLCFEEGISEENTTCSLS